MSGYLSALVSRAQADVAAPPVAATLDAVRGEADLRTEDTYLAALPQASRPSSPAMPAIEWPVRREDSSAPLPGAREDSPAPGSPPPAPSRPEAASPAPIEALPTIAPIILNPEGTGPAWEIPAPLASPGPVAQAPREAPDPSPTLAQSPSTAELLARVDAFLRDALQPAAPAEPAEAWHDTAPAPGDGSQAEALAAAMPPPPLRRLLEPAPPSPATDAGEARSEQAPSLTIGRITVDVRTPQPAPATPAPMSRTVVVHHGTQAPERRSPTHRFGTGQV